MRARRLREWERKSKFVNYEPGIPEDAMEGVGRNGVRHLGARVEDIGCKEIGSGGLRIFF